MHDDQAFLRAIADAPADHAPRLVYADWLDERGDPRGEFIRIEVRLASGGGGANAGALLARRKALARGLEVRWVAAVSRAPADLGGLVELVVPPPRPLRCGDEGNWARLRSEIEFRFPAEFLDYGRLYGTGDISAEGYGLMIANPLDPAYPRVVPAGVRGHADPRRPDGTPDNPVLPRAWRGRPICQRLVRRSALLRGGWGRDSVVHQPGRGPGGVDRVPARVRSIPGDPFHGPAPAGLLTEPGATAAEAGIPEAGVSSVVLKEYQHDVRRWGARWSEPAHPGWRMSKRVWRQLRDRLAIEPSIKGLRPVAAAALDAFEKKHGLRLPTSYRSCCEMFGAGQIGNRRAGISGQGEDV